MMGQQRILRSDTYKPLSEAAAKLYADAEPIDASAVAFTTSYPDGKPLHPDCGFEARATAHGARKRREEA